ncbi:MAG: Gfo/Idh/MocA family oxidoreductase [Pseudomonadota bacterium]
MTRVAVVGAGYFGQFHYDAWTRMDGCALVGLCALSGGEETATRFGVPRVFDNIADMVSETGPDLVDIVSPPETHMNAIATLVPTVKWIICQKPFCRDRIEAQAAVELASEHGARVIVHENFRFQPWYREIKRLIDGGLIGQPFQATFRLRPGDGQGATAYLDRQPYFQKMERFLVHETAIHWIDTFRYLLGEVTSVSADLVRLNPVIAGEDAGILQFRFASGARALFDGNRLADHAAENTRLTMGEMEVEGPKGAIRLIGDGSLMVRARAETSWRMHTYDWMDRHFGGDCVFLTNRAALSSFHAGTPAETEAAAYLRNLDIEAAAYESHETRRWVDV